MYKHARVTSALLRISITLTLLLITFQISTFNYQPAIIAGCTLILQIPLLLVSEYMLYHINKLTSKRAEQEEAVRSLSLSSSLEN